VTPPTTMTGHRHRGRRSALLGLVVNAGLVVVKLTAGLLGHSSALVADGVESTGDIFASAIVWTGLRLSGRKPDARHPFGYGKAEALSAAAVALMLFGAALGIAIQAIREIHAPHHSPAPFTLVTLAFVIVLKETLFRHVSMVAAQVGSIAVKTDAWHHRSDALTSAAVFVGITVALIGGPAWAAADDFAALAAAGIIAVNGGRFLVPALRDLMDGAPDDALLALIEVEARKVEGVLGIEKVLARKVGMGYRVVLHVEADAHMTLEAAHAISTHVRDTLLDEMPTVLDVVVHMEPYCGDPFCRDRARHATALHR